MKASNRSGEFARWLLLQSPPDRRVLARGWGADPQMEARELAAFILDPACVHAQWERLSQAEKQALRHILGAGGTLPIAIMQREHGEVRDIANFPNARAYLDALEAPPSPAERLYVLGLITRHHDERGQIFRVPADFSPLLPAVAPPIRRLDVQSQTAPASFEPGAAQMVERMVLVLLTLAYNGVLQTLDDGALNKASLLKVGAAMQPKRDLKGVRREADWPWFALVRTVVVQAGLLRRTADSRLHVAPAALDWLKAPPHERARRLLNGWMQSLIDEWTLLAGLRWRSTPFALNLPAARRSLLDLFATLPQDAWFSFADVVAAVRRADPYFLRRDGRFDTWLLYDGNNQLLSTEAHWPEVEGRFVEFAAGYVLHIFGLFDLARSDSTATALLRLTPTGAHILVDAPAPPAPVVEPIVVQATFEVVCPPGASLHARFQLARIAELVRADDATIYKLTRKSILQAAERGISGDDVFQFLSDASAEPLPSAVMYSIREWGSQAGQAVLETATLLRADPVLLATMRRTKGVQVGEAEELRPDVWRVPDGDAPALLARLKNAGFGVSDALADSTTPLSEHDLKALVTAAYAYAYVCDELNLPSEISGAMLQRLRKLVPARHADAAQRAAHELRERLGQRGHK